MVKQQVAHRVKRHTDQQYALASIFERNRDEQAQPNGGRGRIKQVRERLPPLLEVSLPPNGPFWSALHDLLEKVEQKHRYVGDGGTGNDRALQL